MRISGNFNIPKVNFTAIYTTDEARPIVQEYIRKSDTFALAYKKLEEESKRNDDDIYVQKTTKGVGLNFQVIDPYTRETKCYLAVDPDPEKSADTAALEYDKFLSTPQPPRQALPKKETQAPTQKKRGFFGIFSGK